MDRPPPTAADVARLERKLAKRQTKNLVWITVYCDRPRGAQKRGRFDLATFVPDESGQWHPLFAATVDADGIETQHSRKHWGAHGRAAVVQLFDSGTVLDALVPGVPLVKQRLRINLRCRQCNLSVPLKSELRLDRLGQLLDRLRDTGKSEVSLEHLEWSVGGKDYSFHS